MTRAAFFRPDLARGLRYERTAAAAFRDHTYGAAIERPAPTLWRRIINFLCKE